MSAKQNTNPKGPMGSAQNKPKNKKRTALTIILSVAAFIVGYVAVGIITDNIRGSSNDDPTALLESTSTEPYKSSQHGFTVEFPGLPRTDNSVINVEGVDVPYTQYSRELDGGSKAYMIQVAEYPKDELDFTGRERGSLDGAINGMAQNTGGTIVSSSNDGTHLGHPSAEAVITVGGDSESHTMRSLNLMKDNTLYTLMVAGESEEAFDSFVNSFKFE